MFRVEERTALVTGASQGIGAAVAKRLANGGARVVLAARSLDKLEDLAEEIRKAGGEACALALDLGDPEGVEEQIAALPEDFAGVDILVNNAGVTADNLLARMKLEEWKRVLTVNLTGTFVVTKALLRGMMRKRWGRVINISSVVGLMGNPGQSNYAASKAGQLGFTRSLARELGSRGITVNAVAPGYILTAMTEKLAESSRKTLESQIALRRLGTVDDVSAAVLFLASEEAGYITGEVLNVSGGLYI